MLVLSRKVNQSIIIGDNIEVMVVDIKPDQIKLGIVAPNNVKIYRKEIYLEIQKANIEAMNKKVSPSLLKSILKKSKQSKLKSQEKDKDKPKNSDQNGKN